MTPGRLALLSLAALVAGAVNSVAGGGTLLTYPALVLAGMNPIVANATSTVALWPGTIGAMLGYRSELRERSPVLLALALPSLLGGACGAILLLCTPTMVFEWLVPFLILFATFLFSVHGSVRERVEATSAVQSRQWWVVAGVLQFAIAVYGGYFGAGIGILMLALLGILGMDDLHAMNGIKVVSGMLINFVAVATFAASGIVDWPVALIMAAASGIGGWAGAGLARRIGQVRLRRAIIGIGALVSAILLARQFLP